MEFQENKSEFEKYLMRKELSETSIKNYMFYYNKLPKDQPLTQEIVNAFLDIYIKRNTKVVRAFLKNYLTFIKNKEIEIPQIKGRAKVRLLKILTREQIEKLFAELQNPRDKLLLLLTFEGGLRLAEVLSLKPTSFKWEEWKKDKSKPGTINIIGKGNKEREVYISSAVMNYAYEYTKYRCNNFLGDKNERLFDIKKRRWQFIVEDVSKKVLGFKISVHSLRHSAAVNLIDQGFNLVELRDFLGHKDVSTTQIYVHPNRQIIKEKYEKIFNQDTEEKREDEVKKEDII